MWFPTYFKRKYKTTNCSLIHWRYQYNWNLLNIPYWSFSTLMNGMPVNIGKIAAFIYTVFLPCSSLVRLSPPKIVHNPNLCFPCVILFSEPAPIAFFILFLVLCSFVSELLSFICCSASVSFTLSLIQLGYISWWCFWVFFLLISAFFLRPWGFPGSP